MTEQKWTTEKPTVKGWYWVYDGKSVNMAMVNEYWDDPDNLRIWIEEIPFKNTVFTHFMGPLQGPEPPKVSE